MGLEENQREFTRVPVKVEATVSSGEKAIASRRTRDVSMKGIYLVCDVPLPLGTDCRVVLFLGGRQSPFRIKARGKVARIDETGMGIEFIAIHGLDSFDNLRKLVLYNAPDIEEAEVELKTHLGLK